MNTSRNPLFLLLAALVAVPTALAQPTAPPLPGPAAAAPTGGADAPSSLFAPALTQVREALAQTRPEKWKAPGPVSQETASNIASIQHDLDATLPGLLATADSNPASVAEVLPAYRNVEALYEVLLRVTEISKLAAPAPQSAALQQALLSLETSRRALGDELQNSAVNQTHALVALQGELRTAQTSLAAAKAAPAPVCPTPAPAKKRTTTKPKSTTSTPAKPQ